MMRRLLVAVLICLPMNLRTQAIVRDVDGNAYRAVTVGSQTWMGENLRVTRDPAGTAVTSYCYDDDPANCRRYGRLYTWDVAMGGEASESVQGICPAGWHVPSDAEWRVLVEHLGGGKAAGHELLVGGSSGLDVPLGGGADFRGKYLYEGEYGLLWASTEVNDERAYHQDVSAAGGSSHFAAMKGARVSVRCLRD